MEKFFDWLNNWFDNANIRLKIVSEELKQMQIEEIQRTKELQEKYGLLREYAIESNIGYT